MNKAFDMKYQKYYFPPSNVKKKSDNPFLMIKKIGIE